MGGGLRLVAGEALELPLEDLKQLLLLLDGEVLQLQGGFKGLDDDDTRLIGVDAEEGVVAGYVEEGEGLGADLEAGVEDGEDVGVDALLHQREAPPAATRPGAEYVAVGGERARG